MKKIDQELVDTLFELYRRGNYTTLAERTLTLLKTYPNELILHSLRGAACHELREYDAAIASYRAALAIKPDFEKIHNSLGIAYLRTGRPDEALAAFRDALQCKPEFAPAWYNAGIAFENLKQWRNAADCYEKAVAVSPGYVEALTSLGNVFWELGEHERVTETLEQALSLRADHVPAWRNLLHFLERANRRDALEDALARARTALGGHPLVRLYTGILADREGDAGRARAELESFHCDSDDPLGLHDERQRHARLARICDRLDDAEAAFGHAVESNRLSSRISAHRGVSKNTYLQYLDYRRGYFTGEYVASWSATEPEEAAPVFIVGFPRSGTTLLDAILRSHPGIRVVEESDAVSRVIDRLAAGSTDHLQRLPALSGDEVRELRKLYYDSLPAGAGEGLCIDRFALNIIYAGEICRLFPAARFIVVLRHPADCVLSCFMQSFYDTPANANFHDLEDAAHLYDRVFGLWRQYENVLQPAVHYVRYEDIVEDLEGACRPVLEFIGATWDPALLEYHRTARERPFIATASYDQVTRPLYAEAKGRWHRYRQQLEPVMPVLEPWIRHFGYGGDS